MREQLWCTKKYAKLSVFIKKINCDCLFLSIWVEKLINLLFTTVLCADFLFKNDNDRAKQKSNKCLTFRIFC